MGQIGNSLRQARLQQGLSLTDAQKATKIRARYLEALEQERFALLPGAAYGRGFLCEYAELLGLDPEPLLLELIPALAAIKGDCWLSVRRGSAAGAVVWQGLLRRGSSLHFASLPLWIRMGAPWNLGATLGSRTLAGLPSAAQPANVLVTAGGARAA